MTLENISLCENGNIELCDNGNISFCTVLVELTHCNDSASDLCDGSEASIIAELEASYVGKVVRINGVCYSVATVESGTPVAVTVDEVYDDCAECCGDLASCDCPCTSWLPPSWPCGGLLEEYQVTGNLASRYDSEAIVQEYQTHYIDWWLVTEYRSSGNATAAKLTPDMTCYWSLSLESRLLYYDGTRASGPTTFRSVAQDWTSVPPPYTGYVRLSSCQWQGVFGVKGNPDNIPTAKDVGQTPAGNYVAEEWGTLPEGGVYGGRANATLTEAT